MRDDLLDNDSIIRGPFPEEKTSLSGNDKGREKRPESSSNDLGGNLVLSVTKANRSKVFETRNIIAFRNQALVSGFGFGVHGCLLERVYIELSDSLTYNVPIILVHERVNTIRSKIFVRIERVKSVLHLPVSRNTV